MDTLLCSFVFFFFNDTATTEIYTLSLHDALPISERSPTSCASTAGTPRRSAPRASSSPAPRSEEHTSELQSHLNLVCRLLLEKKKKKKKNQKSIKKNKKKKRKKKKKNKK